MPLPLDGELKSYIDQSTVLINATNIGMPPYADQAPIDLSLLASGTSRCGCHLQSPQDAASSDGGIYGLSDCERAEPAAPSRQDCLSHLDRAGSTWRRNGEGRVRLKFKSVRE